MTIDKCVDVTSLSPGYLVFPLTCNERVNFLKIISRVKATRVAPTSFLMETCIVFNKVRCIISCRHDYMLLIPYVSVFYIRVCMSQNMLYGI